MDSLRSGKKHNKRYHNVYMDENGQAFDNAGYLIEENAPRRHEGQALSYVDFGHPKPIEFPYVPTKTLVRVPPNASDAQVEIAIAAISTQSTKES